jgi:succinate dehydrogenase / fumarate reductase flavoprotein subunit
VDEAEIERITAAALEPFGREQGENPYAVQHDLQDTMHNLVGIIRTEDELKKALGEIEALDARAGRAAVEGNRQYNPGWHLALDLRSMLAVSACITRAALERRESRGGHTRDDYPGPDPRFGTVNVVVRQREGDVSVTQEPLPQMPADLKVLFEDAK